MRRHILKSELVDELKLEYAMSNELLRSKLRGIEECHARVNGHP